MVTGACCVIAASPLPAALSLPLQHATLPKPSPSSLQALPLAPHSSFHPPYSSVALQDPPTADAMKRSIDLAREVASSVVEINSVQDDLKWGEGAAVARRKRRRSKKRKAAGFSIGDKEGDESRTILQFDRDVTSRLERSRYLTRRQEAEFSRMIPPTSCSNQFCSSITYGWPKQEEAMIDTKVKQMGECSSPVSAYAACCARMKRRFDEASLSAKECRKRITLSYKRPVVSIAATYHGKGLSMEDLVQEGSIGLLRGAQRFDHSKGYKLSTYVYWWIKQGITRAIANKSRLIRFPSKVCEAMNKVTEANSLLKRQLGRWPTYEEIAEFNDMEVSTVRFVSEKSSLPRSMDQEWKEGLRLMDVVHAQDEVGSEAIVDRQITSQYMEKVLSTLSEREVFILRLHYGLNGKPALSCKEIGRLMNLSRERVRQIRSSALSRLPEDKSLVECIRSVVMQGFRT